MEFVTPQYEQKLHALAETLVTPERFQDYGSIATREVAEKGEN